MATGVESITEKLEQVKINNDSYFGNDLSYEKDFLEKIKEKIEEKIPEFEVTYILRKRSMALCFEILKLSENNVREVVRRIDWKMGQYFFQKDGLRELGWCLQYLIDQRSVNYKKEEQVFEKLKSLNFIVLIHHLIDLTIEQFLQNLKYEIVCTVVFFTLIFRNKI